MSQIIWLLPDPLPNVDNLDAALMPLAIWQNWVVHVREDPEKEEGCVRRWTLLEFPIVCETKAGRTLAIRVLTFGPPNTPFPWTHRLRPIIHRCWKYKNKRNKQTLTETTNSESATGLAKNQPKRVVIQPAWETQKNVNDISSASRSAFKHKRPRSCSDAFGIMHGKKLCTWRFGLTKKRGRRGRGWILLSFSKVCEKREAMNKDIQVLTFGPPNTPTT